MEGGGKSSADYIEDLHQETRHVIDQGNGRVGHGLFFKPLGKGDEYMSPRKAMRNRFIVPVVALLVLCAFGLPALAQPVPGGSLDPTTIPQFVDPLPIPRTMPKAGTVGGADYYEIALRQFQQQVLPSKNFPKTTVWGYGPKSGSATPMRVMPRV